MIRVSSTSKDSKSILHWALIFLIFIVSGCNSGDGRGRHTQGSTNGALAFKAVWPQSGMESARNKTESTEDEPDICTAFGIQTISATVLGSTGTKVSTGNWPCDTVGHTGSIGGIPVGSGYRVVIQGMVAEEAAWHGEASDITIEGGRTTVIDRIIMHPLDFVLHASSSDGGRITPAGRIAASIISVQTFTFLPDSGYEIDDVIVDGTSLGYMESYTFSNISANHTIYVSFVPTGGTVETHAITATAGDGGAIVPEGQIEVTQGNDQTFSFMPATGNHIVDVFVDGVSQGAMPSYVFDNVTSDHTIRVAFDTTTYTITASAGPGGSVDPAGTITAAYGSTPAFTIAADAGFYLAELRVNGASVLPQSAHTFQPVTDDGTLEAVFKPVRFLDAAAQGGGDGTSWGSAFRTLEDAIQATVDGDEIWIKAGTYLLTNQVSVHRAVAIYGGYAGTEVFAHERNWQDNPAIFDAQRLGRVFFISADARIDGLVVQNGNLDTGFYDLQGGAVFIDHCSPTIANCTFLNNHIAGVRCSGGAIYADNSSPTFQNCHFEGNNIGCEYSKGGAMYLNACTSTISGCTFIDNQLGWSTQSFGGGLEINSGTAVITGSQFSANHLDGQSLRGGAISSMSANLSLSECLFDRNVIIGNYCDGAALYHNGTDAAQNPVIQNTLFLGNAAGQEDLAGNSRGGALFNENAAPSIRNCTFSGNTARARSISQGGAIANISGTPDIINTILWGNRAIIDTYPTTSDGQGMQLYDDTASSSTVSFSVIDGPVPNGNNNLTQEPDLDAFGHLRPGSIGLNAGNDGMAPDLDIDGESRPQNSRSDIGADELVDGDADQIPDYWEIHYGLDIARDDSSEDLDGDGLSNLVEYRTGLDPTQANPASVALHRGWYDDSGFHDAANNGTRCGSEIDTEYRSYFTFGIPAVSGSVVGAVLRLEVVSFQGIRQTESFSVHDVTTNPATLEASGSGQSAIFADLGDGSAYVDKVNVSPGDVGTIISFALSATAVTDIQASLGGSFSVGISPASEDADEVDIYTFSQASEIRTHQLVLVVE